MTDILPLSPANKNNQPKIDQNIINIIKDIKEEEYMRNEYGYSPAPKQPIAPYTPAPKQPPPYTPKDQPYSGYPEEVRNQVQQAVQNVLQQHAPQLYQPSQTQPSQPSQQSPQGPIIRPVNKPDVPPPNLPQNIINDIEKQKQQQQQIQNALSDAGINPYIPPSGVFKSGQTQIFRGAEEEARQIQMSKELVEGTKASVYLLGYVPAVVGSAVGGSLLVGALAPGIASTTGSAFAGVVGAGAVSGAVTGATTEAYSQTLQKSLGWRQNYDIGRIGMAGLIGGAIGGLFGLGEYVYAKHTGNWDIIANRGEVKEVKVDYAKIIRPREGENYALMEVGGRADVNYYLGKVYLGQKEVTFRQYGVMQPWKNPFVSVESSENTLQLAQQNLIGGKIKGYGEIGGQKFVFKGYGYEKGLFNPSYENPNLPEVSNVLKSRLGESIPKFRELENPSTFLGRANELFRPEEIPEGSVISSGKWGVIIRGEGGLREATKLETLYIRSGGESAQFVKGLGSKGNEFVGVFGFSEGKNVGIGTGHMIDPRAVQESLSKVLPQDAQFVRPQSVPVITPSQIMGGITNNLFGVGGALGGLFVNIKPPQQNREQPQQILKPNINVNLQYQPTINPFQPPTQIQITQQSNTQPFSPDRDRPITTPERPESKDSSKPQINPPYPPNPYTPNFPPIRPEKPQDNQDKEKPYYPQYTPQNERPNPPPPPPPQPPKPLLNKAPFLLLPPIRLEGQFSESSKYGSERIKYYNELALSKRLIGKLFF